MNTLTHADEHELAKLIARHVTTYCRCMPNTQSMTRDAAVPYTEGQVLSIVVGAMDQFFAEREDAAAIAASRDEAMDLRLRQEQEDAA